MKSLSNSYKISNIIVSFGWLLLVFFPTWEFSDIIIKNGIVVALSTFYIYLLFIRKNIKGENYPKGGFTSLEGVIDLFKNPKFLLAGWIHYLAFDLMLGLYIKNQSLEIGMSHLLLIPCLVLTFILGPLGFLLFFVLETSMS